MHNFHCDATNKDWTVVTSALDALYECLLAFFFLLSASENTATEKQILIPTLAALLFSSVAAIITFFCLAL